MKLNDKQVIALTQKLFRELQVPVSAYNKEVQETIDALVQEKLSLPENQVLVEFANYSNYTKYLEQFIKNKKYKEEFDALPKTKMSISFDKVKEDVIYATIDATDANDIIKRIKEAYAANN